MTIRPFEQVPPVPAARLWLLLVVVVSLVCAWLTVSAVILEVMIQTRVAP